MNVKCDICDSENVELLLNDYIRLGKPGELTDIKENIYKCQICSSSFLENYDAEYESEEYRKKVDGENDFDHYRKKHGESQSKIYSIFGNEFVKNKVIADLGCGGGIFLDLCAKTSESCIAIDPNKVFLRKLSDKGYDTFSYPADAIPKYQGKIDLIFSFATIEHIKDPIKFLNSIHKLLKPTGKFIFSTPNHDDWLLNLIGDDYRRYFYRKAHKWYLNKRSLSKIAELTSFNPYQFQFKQDYDLSNLIYWLKDKTPTGNQKNSTLICLDDQYKSIIEEKGLSNFIYAYFEPKS